jgi:hypothetical protein
MSDQEVTRVVFRWWRESDSVIALFPDIEDRHGLVSSYMHVGQHGPADYMGIIANSRPATPEEYTDLKRELESAPYNYNLKVVMHGAEQERR